MSANLLDPAAVEAFRHYAVFSSSTSLQALGNRGGFSGAHLWRVESPTGSFCLRAWPAGEPSIERLAWIHSLMRLARAAGLHFVPTVCSTSHGATWVGHADRLWDLSGWMPGQADSHDRCSPARMESACRALAQLHAAWAGTSSEIGPCPGIQRRLESAREWISRLHSGWRPGFSFTDAGTLRPWAERAWDLLRAWLPEVPRVLASWADRPLPLQPCLCDVWHDHVLFEGDSVTGLIDYGGVKVDHIAVDLARLLGSMAGDKTQLRDAGLRIYGRTRQLTCDEEALVGLLDQTGAVIAIATWLKWLYVDRRAFEDMDSVTLRLTALVERIEKWPREGH